MRNRNLRWLWLSVAVIALDQLTKWLAASQLDYAQPVPVLPLFNLTLMHNTGAAFSFLAGAGGWQRWFFVGLAVLISAFLLRWLQKLPVDGRGDARWTAAGLTLVLGGAIGNVIDRLLHGYVIDFIDLYWGRYHWPAFNIADSAITVGVILLLLTSLRGEPKPSGEKTS